MPRRAESLLGGNAYHLLNRANGRLRLFRKEADFAAFEELIAEAFERLPLRILAYTVMSNHWHFIVWPKRGTTRCGHDEMWARRGLVGVFQWFTLMHSQRGHAHHGTSGMGHVYQGRFKSFPIAADEHLFAAMRLLRSCIARGRPFGNEKWTKKVAMQLHLESTLRPRGRPRKAPADETSPG